MKVVRGEDVILSIAIDSVYYPVLCASSISFTMEQEMIEKTGPNSPSFREYTARLSTWSASITGLTPINNGSNISWFYLLQDSVRRAVQPLKFTFSDEDGNTKTITGNALMKNNDFTASVSSLMQGQIDFQGTGDISMDAIDPPAGSYDILADRWATVNGQSYISGASSIEAYTLTADDELLFVSVEGVEFDIVTGTPSSREAQFVTSPSVKIQFASDFVFDGTQKVWVMFKRTL